MSDTQEIYMQKLQELLCDEDKMVNILNILNHIYIYKLISLIPDYHHVSLFTT